MLTGRQAKGSLAQGLRSAKALNPDESLGLSWGLTARAPNLPKATHQSLAAEAWSGHSWASVGSTLQRVGEGS